MIVPAHTSREKVYNWRTQSPGIDSIKLIRKRINEALDRFARGEGETVDAALDLRGWIASVKIEGVPEADEKVIRSFLTEMADAYCLIPPDRGRGTRAIRALLAFMVSNG